MANRNDRNDDERGGWEHVQRDFGRYQSGDDLRRSYGYDRRDAWRDEPPYRSARRDDDYRPNDRNSSWQSREIDRQRGSERGMDRGAWMNRSRDEDRAGYDRGRRDDDDRGRWMARDEHERGRWMQGGYDPDVRGLADRDRDDRDRDRGWSALDTRAAQRRNEHIERDERHRYRHDDDQQRWMGSNRRPLMRGDERWMGRDEGFGERHYRERYGDRDEDRYDRSDNASMRSGYQHTMGRGDEARWNRPSERDDDRGRYVSQAERMNRGPEDFDRNASRDLRGRDDRDRDRPDRDDDRGWFDRARDWFRGDRDDETPDDRFSSRGRH